MVRASSMKTRLCGQGLRGLPGSFVQWVVYQGFVPGLGLICTDTVVIAVSDQGCCGCGLRFFIVLGFRTKGYVRGMYKTFNKMLVIMGLSCVVLLTTMILVVIARGWA